MTKLEKIKQDGLDNLQFVLDFDRTITGPVGDLQAPPMISFLRNSDILGEEYRQEANANFEYYYPFEKSDDISKEEKNKLMSEWWEKHLDLLKKYKLNVDKIKQIAYSENLVLREGVKELFEFCFHNNIPIIIFSAGLLGKGSILLFLERFQINFKNIQIVINELIYDELGYVSGHRQPIIHSENKNESILELENVKQRKNTILAGDGIGDSTMVLDRNGSIVYRIGICDSKKQEDIEKYNKNFDVVTDNFHNLLNF
jgi:HAD superfamily hydrolase (TIGR01544 family)